jgi:hypothetical protein
MPTTPTHSCRLFDGGPFAGRVVGAPASDNAAIQASELRVERTRWVSGEAWATGGETPLPARTGDPARSAGVGQPGVAPPVDLVASRTRATRLEAHDRAHGTPRARPTR